ncbi:MAG: AMP-binding protein [Deltaproteobacteria bacterium]|nr:AMP-binding protein [Deltaproteobacteria bacterium]
MLEMIEKEIRLKMEEKGIGYWITRRSFYNPGKVALIFEGKEWTYRQFNERINQLSRALMDHGLKKGDRIAILAYNCNQYLELYWACAKTGAVFVPLNVRLVSRELEILIKDIEIKPFFFYGKEFSDVVKELKAMPATREVQKYVCIGTPEIKEDVEYEEFIADYPVEEPDVKEPPMLEDPQVILFTSGTTGKAKAALLPHRKTLWNTINNELAFSGLLTANKYLLNLPLFHSGGLFIATMPFFHQGKTIVIHKRFDSQKALEDIEKYKINMIGGVPAMFQMILAVPNFDDYDISSVTSCTVGAQITPVSLLEKIKEKFKVDAVGQVYGCSETSVCVTLTPDRPLDAEKTGSIGLPCFHGEVKVINEKGEPVKWGSGEVGEICYRGPMCMLGYVNMPGKTKEAVDPDGWFHYGDMGYVDEDGYIFLKDRKTDMYISGGENVYPREVENVLINHPKIKNIAIIPKPDEKWGEVGLAIVNPVPGESLTEKEVLDYGVGKIAKYKLPKEVIITDKPIPITITGKILKFKLIDEYIKQKG